MVLACPIAALGIGVSNPFSVGGEINERFNSARPLLHIDAVEGRSHHHRRMITTA